MSKSSTTGTQQGLKPMIIGSPMSGSEVEAIKKLLMDTPPSTYLTSTEPTFYGQLTHYWCYPQENRGTWRSCIRITVSELHPQSY